MIRHSLVSAYDDMAEARAERRPTAPQEFVDVLTAFGRQVADSAPSGIPRHSIAEAGHVPGPACSAASGKFRRVDEDYAWRVVIAPLLLSIIWKHSFATLEPEPLDPGRHLAVHLDLLFDGPGVRKREGERH